jgi:hypothetical protein
MCTYCFTDVEVEILPAVTINIGLVGSHNENVVARHHCLHLENGGCQSLPRTDF